MSAMTMEFDGVRELSMEEIEAVNGGEGGGSPSTLETIGEIVDQIPDEVKLTGVVATAALGCAVLGSAAGPKGAAAGAVVCGVVAGATYLLSR